MGFGRSSVNRMMYGRRLAAGQAAAQERDAGRDDDHAEPQDHPQVETTFEEVERQRTRRDEEDENPDRPVQPAIVELVARADLAFGVVFDRNAMGHSRAVYGAARSGFRVTSRRRAGEASRVTPIRPCAGLAGDTCGRETHPTSCRATAPAGTSGRTPTGSPGIATAGPAPSGPARRWRRRRQVSRRSPDAVAGQEAVPKAIGQQRSQ